MRQFPLPLISEPAASQLPISSASRRRLARHLVGLPLKDIERDLVLETLASTDGNRATSARLLGLSVRTLRKKITAYSADGADVTPARGAPSRAKAEDGTRRSDADTPRGFLQRDSIFGDARLEQATRDALRVRLRPVTPCDLTVSTDLSGSAERCDVSRRRRLVRRLITTLAAIIGKLIPSAH